MNGSLISKITQDGKLSNLAGRLAWDSEPPKDGFGASATFDWISAMAVDSNGNIYLCDANAIRKITPAGQVTTLSGRLGWDIQKAMWTEQVLWPASMILPALLWTIRELYMSWTQTTSSFAKFSQMAPHPLLLVMRQSAITLMPKAQRPV